MTEQPHISGGLTQAANKLQANATKSQQKLEALQFDPIEELVERHRVLKAEAEYFKDWKEGKIKVMRNDGKGERAFPWDFYLKTLDQMAAIEDKLLRYGYGRVSETSIIENKERMPLTINLSNGAKAVVNGNEVSSD